MQVLKTAVIGGLLFSAQFTLASDEVNQGKQLFEQNCAQCHGVAGGMDMSKRLAPPMIAVKKHYTKHYADQEAFTQAVVAWVANPQKNKSKMKGAIRHFDLMPVVSVSSDDVEKIATYVFANELDKPEGFDEHMKKKHGEKKGGKHSHDHGDKKSDCGKGKHSSP